MKHPVALVAASLLSILLSIFHLADDIVYGMSPGYLTNLWFIVLMAIWVYTALRLAERRGGLAVNLIFSLLASFLPVIHMVGKSGMTAKIPDPGRAFFFVTTLLVLGVSAMVSVALSTAGLWNSRRSRAK